MLACCKAWRLASRAFFHRYFTHFLVFNDGSLPFSFLKRSTYLEETFNDFWARYLSWHNINSLCHGLLIKSVENLERMVPPNVNWSGVLGEMNRKDLV